MGKLSINLQTVYFNLFSEFLNFRLEREELYKKLARQLQVVLDTSYVALYQLSVENQNYQLLTETPILNRVSGKQIVAYKDIHNEGVFHSEFVNNQLKVIQLGQVLLVVAKNERLCIELQDVIKVTEKFIVMIDKLVELKGSEYHNQYLYDLSTRLFSENEKKNIFIQIIDALKALYPNDSYYLLLTQDNETLSSTLPIRSFEISDAVTKRVSTKAFMTGEFQVEDQVEENKTYHYAPLSGKQGTYGVLQIITPISTPFSMQQIDFIKQFANLAGIAIERASLYEDSKHQVSSLSLINEFAQALNSNLDLSEITKLLKKEIMNVCNPSEIGFVYFNDSKLADLEIQAESTTYFNTVEGQRFIIKLFEETLNDSESIFSGKYEDKEHSSYQSIMAIPMNYSGYSHGLTVILHKEMYYFTFETFKLMEALIQHATLAITNAHLKARLHKTVITDFLTGLYSRNHLEEVINHDMENGDNGVLLLCDIDNFKRVNDRYGHHVGDQVIKQVANVMQSFSRKEDIPARWGGEELAIYLPNISLTEGVRTAEFIRKQVSEVTDPHVTISCGVSSWMKEEKKSIVNLFIRTDKALYTAKESGKNQVIKS